MLNSHDPVNLRAWKKDGSILDAQNCISVSYNFYEGTHTLKFLNSGEFRKVRDVCIFEINSLEVFL
jgi:hypothetical protein